MLNTSKSTTKKEIERDAVRQKIISTATQMFIEQGCKKITMDYIAMNMHISKRTIYELFKDKEELLILCIKQLVEQTDTRWAFVKDRAQDPMVVMMLMIHSMSSFISTYSKLIDDIEKYYPTIRATIFKERPIHNEEFIKKSFSEAKQRGIIRSNVNIDIAARLLVNLSTLVNTLVEFDAARRSYIISELTFTYMRGMMTVAAIQDYNNKEAEFNQIIQEADNHTPIMMAHPSYTTTIC